MEATHSTFSNVINSYAISLIILAIISALHLHCMHYNVIHIHIKGKMKFTLHSFHVHLLFKFVC